MKEERGNINVYIKIMYRGSLLVPYTLRKTVAILECWLNVGVNRFLQFFFFSIFFFLNIGKGMSYRAFVATTLTNPLSRVGLVFHNV
jgi:hypothetical protein